MPPTYGLFIAALAASALAPAAAAPGPPLNLTFPPHPPASALANVIEDHFIGLSWELSSFDTLWGVSVNRQPTAMQNYLHNLIARMSKPLRIRVGGNGMDGSTYVPDLPVPIEHVDPDAYFNDIPVNFGSIFFDLLNGMADKVGEMQFSVGLSMRDPHNFEAVAQLGKAARDKLGKRLDSMFLGNEPDLYAGHGERHEYDIETYIPELEQAVAELDKVGALGDSPILGGPTICCRWDLHDILDAGMDQLPYKYYTLQRYPNHACQGLTDRNQNLTYYLSHSNVEPYLGWQTQGILQAQQAGVPVIMSEYNSVACGGTYISSTFAMSLWAVDVGLKAATMNYSAVFLHTREFDIQYNLFDPPTPTTGTEPGWRTGSPYYAALFLSEITDADGSVVVELDLNSNRTGVSDNFAAYGIYDQAGKTRGKIALINFTNDTQVFDIPADVSNTIEYRLLQAPSVWERTNISWAGQTISTNGDLEGDQATIEMTCDDGCRLTIPGPSAALVVLGTGSGKLFQGNSTIAGIGAYISGASPLAAHTGAYWRSAIVTGIVGTWFAMF
ncbi:hypothetical protein CVT24_012733 [Panaeolus cyanescens]|uniref:Beta-glucuronidase C-terminal domain-containing protein n=1 Tax=Panaeolus cyanescens TaxID=181874 RepID=A0A409W6P8_9AGAR|nr:hypothetical protein CVT24_012733 [Panaeolus cyanescens]